MGKRSTAVETIGSQHGPPLRLDPHPGSRVRCHCRIWTVAVVVMTSVHDGGTTSHLQLKKQAGAGQVLESVRRR